MFIVYMNNREDMVNCWIKTMTEKEDDETRSKDEVKGKLIMLLKSENRN